jgi:hypothetical protein
MNSYTYIESFFRSILSQSKTIEGRFFVLPKNGQELNSDTLDQVIKDTPEVKYPLCGMLPPPSSGDFTTASQWEDYHFTLFFLDTVYYSNNQIKELNPDTGTSMQPIIKDWENMKQAAVDFIRVLDFVQRGHNSTGQVLVNSLFRLNPKTKRITPVSFVTTNRLGGVRLDFDASIYLGCGISDYIDGVYFVVPSSTADDDTLIISGPGSFDRLVTNEVPSGVIDGVNPVFTTAFDFIPETVEVFINGMKNKIIRDYQLTGTRTIMVNVSLEAGDTILVNYIKS